MTNDRKARAARAEQMRKEREKADRKQRNMISVAIVAVVVVLVALAGWGVKSLSDQNAKATEVIEPKNLIDNGVPYIPAGDVELDEDAPVAETFEDFLCPACGQFAFTTGPVLHQLADEGKIDLRFMPFSFLHRMSTNDYSRRAMNLAMCAVDEQGPDSFWAVHSALFMNQPAEGGAGPDNAALLATAAEAGVTGLDECQNTQKFVPWIDEVRAKLSKERNIGGTPTLQLNGVESPARTPEDLESAIAAAKKK